MISRTENRDGTKYEWTQTKEKDIADAIGLWNILLFILCIVFGLIFKEKIFLYIGIVSFIGLFAAAILFSCNSKRDNYTRLLYDRVDRGLKSCKTYADYLALYNYFYSQAYEFTDDTLTKGMCRVSWGETTKNYAKKLETAVETAKQIEKSQNKNKVG